ncbi:hypothetical protein [Ramlibacter pallidus]|uniref:N-linked glycosylation glycosyltransferase PglG n=1 Tax=Ramlibacter pallidus TaxID=2780087 RepID=A0ABR9S2N2_9BURK|nr:hypothetical protein [Ramlibacter pallidus]MBE7367767.1 hypothetical protein [Ramlibacter pallidus]
MKLLLAAFAFLHGVIAILFACAALALLGLAVQVGWSALANDFGPGAAQKMIEAVGLLAAAVLALQISQTIVEEEIVRGAHSSTPTRVRRFLSRFFVVVTVALAIEGLVATFHAVHEDLTQLLYAAALLAGTASLVAAWGLFVWFNRAAEDVEPEGMREVKREDEKLRD